MTTTKRAQRLSRTASVCTATATIGVLAVPFGPNGEGDD
jgi:hypothetical protein